MLSFKNNGFSQMSVLINLLIIIILLILSLLWQTHNTDKEQAKFNYNIAKMLANDIANKVQLNYPATIPGNDISYWQQAIRENLHNGFGEITIMNNNLTIKINWQDLSNHKKKIMITTLLLPYKP